MLKYTKTTVILLLGLPIILLGEPITLTTAERTYDLSAYFEILEAEELDIDEVKQAASSGQFKPFSTETKLLPFKDYWIKIDVDNRYPYTEGYIEWVIHFSPLLSNIELHFTDIDQQAKVRKSGLFTPVSERIFTAALRENIIKFPLQEGQSTTLYILIESDRKATPPLLSARLMPLETYLKTLKKERAGNAFFVGFLWMMIILSLAFFFQTWGKVYIFYSLYLIGVSTYTSYVEGDIADWLIPWLFPENPQYIFFVKLVVYVAIVSYMSFLRSFLDLKQMLPKWDKIFAIASWSAIPLCMMDAFLIVNSNFSSIVPDRITLSYGIVFTMLNLLFLRPLYKARDKKVYFIFVGITAMSAGIILFVIERLRNPEFSVSFIEIGTIIEILAFTLALAYRQRVNERARLKAHFELEKSKFVQQQEQAEADRLRELDELKNRLYTNITHEFRTPLTVIMGMAEEIKDPKVKRLIHRNSNNLLRLINQILDLSKLESGKSRLNLIQADIITYLQYLNESFLSAAEAKHIRLSFYPEVPQLVMDFDEEKIQQIVYNLLSNAIKFTPENGTIIFHAKLLAEQEQSMLQLKIQDSGSGIPTEHLAYIFDRFYQVENTNNPNQGGTGIGLALTKELVEYMGGSITVSSQERQGSLFTVLLPIHKVNALKKGEWKFDPVLDATPAVDDSTKSPYYSSDKPLLLIIEDNADVIEYIETILEKSYEIKSVRNGQAGIDTALEIIPDVIISDIMMPIKNGFEVCKFLKTDHRTSHIPIILLTAKTAKEEQLRGLQYGADAFLTKPFHKEELLIRLEKLVELRKKLQTLYLKGAQPPTLSKEDEFLQLLHQVIAEKIDDTDLSVNDLCRAVKLSHAHLYRKLKALTNQTPVQFIRYIRLQKAKDLLENSKMNISEIAYTVGFADPNYFSRIYHKEMGLTPSETRK